MIYETFSQAVERFEREEWGTNDFGEIKEKIRSSEWQAAQDRMTGMDEEQADWDAEE